MSYNRREDCRVCQDDLQDVLDLGVQCSQGAFPGPGEGDPPAYPLVLTRCVGCGLVQLRHTAPPEELYRSYWYRSGVSQTMREHLAGLFDEGLSLLRGQNSQRPIRFLDIGSNDNYLLGYASSFHPAVGAWGIDPSSIAAERMGPDPRIVNGYFPQDMPADAGAFDLITSVAMFYDIDDPVDFARAVKDRLTPDGLWCVEVGYLPDLLRNGDYSSICAEHLCYYEVCTLLNAGGRAGLWLHSVSFNQSNGGSVRIYFSNKFDKFRVIELPDRVMPGELDEFQDAVYAHRNALCLTLSSRLQQGQRIHLLGASTKMNTVLQFCGLDHRHIEAASDRDPRKNGRRTPGTNIPIVSEEQSRAMKPDAYLVGPWHFRDELICRERGAGFEGELIFPFPRLEVVSLKGEAVPTC